jgi:hypothetical protein
MATILLSAAGAAVGSSFGTGTVLGLTGAVIGRAAGATVGRVIDQRLLGAGSDPVERGRIERFRVTAASEGAPVAQLFGRMRLGGQVIWATQFVENTASGGGGGKGAPSQPKTTTYSYAISLAVALCEGEIRRVGRIWVDGIELDRSTVNMRVYTGTEDQLPDPLMEAVEGAGSVPAYRGIAYVVFEDLDLSPYGNRVPQFAFEVTRASAPERDFPAAAADAVRAVALMPGTGEYALATQPVTQRLSFGRSKLANVNAEGGGTDFTQSLAQLRAVAPQTQSVSLIYSWFGDDLRAGACTVKPKVEDATWDGREIPWRAGGIGRSEAEELAQLDGRPVYGGTPADGSVMEAIAAIKAGGQEVLFYPFLLMEILAGNGLPDPYGGAEQAALPWRGRITGDLAPGQPGSPDQTAANALAVASFFGTATAADFTISSGVVTYGGPDEWSYSRFILHCAALCAAAGGVEAFCIGSEMRGLTQMRDGAGFPAVDQLRALAAEVRTLLPDAKLSYAADWSEYFGYQPQDGSGDVFFHLDPLWADDEIDFVAIDNYMPLSDWRDGTDHADADWGVIHNLDYLKANIEGGEGYDWFYPTAEARAAQRRVPITDGARNEPWVFRYKAIRDWWSNAHTERFDPALRSELAQGDTPAAWSPLLGAVVSPEAGSFGTYAAPVAVAGGTDPWQRIASPTPVFCEADADYELRFHIKPGSSGGFRARIMAAATDDIDILSDGVIAPVISGTAFSKAGDLEVTTGENGIVTVRVLFTLSVASNVTIEIGPGAGTPGEDVILFGAEVIAWPYATTDWVPQSKPIWFTEIGCAAIDKGTNQPNKFLDPKSSESAIPFYSNGRRDDLIQAQYLRATMEYWSDPANNPVSDVYAAPMLDMDRAHVWAWDARPWPAFPNERDIWSDGANWTRGHWINGRIEAVPLDQVVAELCETAGVTAYDVSRLYGLVRGHVSGETESARSRLQALMLAYGFQAVEREGYLVFLPLPAEPEAVIEAARTALNEDGNGGIAETRASEAEMTGRVRVAYSAAEADYSERLAEAVFPGDGEDAVSSSTLPLALTGAEAQATAERWLAEARVARDSITFSLPPSQRRLGAGAMVALEDGSTWRIDRVEDRGARAVEAVRVEPSVRDPSEEVEEFAPTAEFVPPVPVSPVFMDLPLITGNEVAHAPHLAVAARPWPGSVAAYSSAAPDGFTLNSLIERGAIAGDLVTPLAAAAPGLWDRSGPLRVQLASGTLSSAEINAVLNGANIAAIGSGDDGEWEVIQFADATLVGDGLWDIGLRLRGQQGSDGIMPDLWPEGSLFVLLNGAPQQVDLPLSARNLARYWRIGPARRSVDDASYVERVAAFAGVGLRPYRPAHLRAVDLAGDLAVSWIRRTRIDGDSWESLEVPLGEASERYLLRITDASGTLREDTLATPHFTYTAAMRAADGALPPFQINVAQVSERFGPGPFARIEING